MDFAILLVVGLVVGFFGAVIGSGGGFFIVPLLLFFTDLSPQVIAGTSLTVVLMNTVSSTYAYRRQSKIDYKLARVFVLAMIPGTLIGIYMNQQIDVGQFSLLLGVILILVSILMFKDVHLRIPHFIPKPMHIKRNFKDSLGKDFSYEFSVRRSALFGFVFAVISPLVGIGGGVLRTPTMITVIGIPHKIAVATSHLISLATSLLSVLIFAKYSQIAYELAIPMGLGVLFGAQAGAFFSMKSRVNVLRAVISSVLFMVGVWLLTRFLLGFT